MNRSMRRRPSRSVPAAIAAVLLTAVGAVLAVAAAQHLAGGAWPTWFSAVLDPVSSARRAAPWTIAAWIALAVLGLACLVAAWKPGRRRGLLLAEGDDAELVLSERGLSRLVGARVKDVDGIETVQVAVSRRTVSVAARTPSSATDRLTELVRGRVDQVVDQLAPRPRPRVVVRIRSEGDR